VHTSPANFAAGALAAAGIGFVVLPVCEPRGLLHDEERGR
jgi:hypothetical protein